MVYQYSMAKLTSSHNLSFSPGAVNSQHRCYHWDRGCNFHLLPLGEWLTAEGTTWFFSLLLCTVCVKWAVNLVYIRCTKERCKKLVYRCKQSVHRKTSPKPLVGRGCFKPSGIICISLSNPTFNLFLGSGFGFRFLLSPFPLPNVSKECGDTVFPESASSCGVRVWSKTVVSNQSPPAEANTLKLQH